MSQKWVRLTNGDLINLDQVAMIVDPGRLLRDDDDRHVVLYAPGGQKMGELSFSSLPPYLDDTILPATAGQEVVVVTFDRKDISKSWVTRKAVVAWRDWGDAFGITPIVAGAYPEPSEYHYYTLIMNPDGSLSSDMFQLPFPDLGYAVDYLRGRAKEEGPF